MTRLSLALLLTACSLPRVGNGDMVTETRDVDGANGLNLRNFVDATVVLGEPASLSLTCDENLMDELVTDVNDGVLEIGNARLTTLVSKKGCTAEVGLPELHFLENDGSGHIEVIGDVDGLDAVTATGSGGIDVSGLVSDLGEVRSDGSGPISIGTIDTCELTVQHTGSGRVTVDQLTACLFEVDQSGSGGLEVGGNVETAQIDLNGSGGFGDAGLTVRAAEVRINGSGGGELTVTESLTARLTGSGGLVVHGNPPQREVSELGSGRVTFSGE